MASSASAQSSDHPLRPHSRRGSNVARKLKTIVDVAEEFATDSDIKAVVGLIDQTLGLQHSLKQKSEDLETLEKVIRESKARFETSSQDSLAIYETAKEKLELELKSCKDEVAALTDEVERKVHDVELLKGSEAKLHSEVKRLQDTSRAQTEEASANSTKIKDLEGNLKISRDENVGLQTQLRQERDLHAQARSNNVNSKQRFDSLEKEYNRILQEWQLAQSLTVQLTEEDPEELSMNLDRMWSHTIQLVNSTFSQDVSEEVIHVCITVRTFLDHELTKAQNDAAWKPLREYDYGQPAPPVIPSNSKSSKQMRMALVLAIIARKFDAHLFQPTYFLDTNVALRDLLIRQAQDESRKEAAIRGIIQALLPKEQDSAASSQVKQACEEVIQIIHGLIPSALSPEFRERLEEIADEARDRWKDILRSKNAITPTFELEDYEGYAWNELWVNSDQVTMVVKARDRNNDDDYDEQSLVVFPRLYLWDMSREDPLSRGVILPVSQTATAKEEMMLLSKSRGLTRDRTRIRRAPNGINVRRPSESKGFLDQSLTS